MRSSLLLCLLLLSSPVVAARDFAIDHLEPASWWVGMRHHRVELMVHGQGVGTLSARVSYPGVSLEGVQRVDNPDYLFVTIDIAPQARPGRFAIEFLDGDTVAVRHPYLLQAREPGSAMRRGFDPSDAIYLVAPDRFANGDPGNDSVPGMLETADRGAAFGRHGGDIAGIDTHLDYLAGMGFTQLWSMPLLENDQPSGSYHGYAITDLYRIDPRFGSNADYRDLSRDARARGIGIIMDVVLNHIGSNHWWMHDLPTPDWINHADSYVETNHRRTTIQDPHAAPADRDRFTRGWFVRAMPDLNQRNPHVATYLIQNTLWWIEYAGLSGIREDTFGYADTQFLSDWGRAVLEEYPHFSMVGEEWSDNPAIVAHWQRGKVNPDGHVPHMPSMMDFPIDIALRDALQQPAGGDAWVHLYETLANDFQYPDPGRLVVFAENHDMTRLLAQLDGDVALWKLGMAYVATVRGTPQYFYGSEVLLTGPKERNDGLLRADMPGGWAGDASNAFTGAGLTAAQRDAQDYLRTLLNWRRHTPAVQTGKLQHYAPQDGVYVYFRYDDDATVMVALNRNPATTPLALGRFGDFIHAGSRGHDVIADTDIDLRAPLVLAAKSATIIEIR